MLEKYLNLVAMLRELDLEKNSMAAIKDVLNIVADELEEYAPIVNAGVNANEEK